MPSARLGKPGTRRVRPSSAHRDRRADDVLRDWYMASEDGDRIGGYSLQRFCT